MKRSIKPMIWLPILIGIIVGILIFILGYGADAPGLCLIGLVSGFLLIMWGVHNAGVIKKGLLAPILLFCFGTGGILLSVALLLDGEFEDTPGMALIGVALGVILIIVGMMRLRKARAGKGQLS